VRRPWLLLAVLVLVVLPGLAALALAGYAKLRNRCNTRAGEGTILIIAPHPDDSVISAGGYGIQTLEAGGTVVVAFLTGTPQTLEEAYSAWEIAGSDRSHMIPLHWGAVNIEITDLAAATDSLARLITRVEPDAVFMQLYEGGHRDHDLANYLVGRAVRSLSDAPALYECPEYNFYFSVRDTPEKILDGVTRLIPFVRYDSPPGFVGGAGRRILCMSDSELATKRRMLEVFHSQKPKDLLLHFRFNDRFQEYRGHDYHRPPHDNGNKLVHWLRNQRIPFFSSLFVKPYWKWRTIHGATDRRPLDALFPEGVPGTEPGDGVE
jgi:hypothetical protein